MLGLRLVQVASAMDAIAQGDPDLELARVVVDSRQVRPGDLFVALRGDRTDGHLHLEDAMAAGAVAAVVLPDGAPRPQGMAYLVVPDPLEALAALARFHLGRLQAKVIGITGSVGKTTAKDFLLQLMGGASCAVHAAPASYNSEIGLPLAVLSAPLGTRTLILEYGINAPGEMAALLRIARPDQAWITAIAAAHLEGLQDLRQVAAEKSQLGAAVPEVGKVWLDSATDTLVGEHAKAWCALKRIEDPLSLARIEGLALEGEQVNLHHRRWGRMSLPLVARHQVALALTAARIAQEAGVDGGILRQRLSRLKSPPGRLTIVHRAGRVFIHDAYNANPASLRAALALLGDWPRASRRIAVVGTMAELGPTSELLHRQAGHFAAGQGIDHLIGIGGGGGWIADAAARGMRTTSVPDLKAAEALLGKELQAGDVILLKASRTAGLERLLELWPQQDSVPEEAQA